MSNTKSLPQHHCYDWSSGDHRSIEIRLSVRREEIAGILHIGCKDVEAVRIVDQSQPADRSVGTYIKRRNTCSGVEIVSRADLVLDEIRGILCRFVADVSNLNQRASQN